MNAEFNWWLLIVGLVVGGGLTWLVLMDTRRREVDVDEAERPREALWLSRMLADEGHEISPETVERMLVLHRTYLEAPPPDDPSPRPAADTPAADTPAAATPAPDEDPSELPAEDRIGVQGPASDVRQ